MTHTTADEGVKKLECHSKEYLPSLFTVKICDRERVFE